MNLSRLEEIVNAELDGACRIMADFRPHLPFSHWERAAAFSAFVTMAREFRAPRAEAMLDDLSMAARAIAIDHASSVLPRGPYAEALRHAGLRFDPIQEAAWGQAKAEHEAWNLSLTRAMVMLLRGLARPLWASEASIIESLVRDVPLVDLEGVSKRLFERARSVRHEWVTLNDRDVRLTADPSDGPGNPRVPMMFVAFRCPGDVASLDGTSSTPCDAALQVPRAVGPFHSVCPRCFAFHVVSEKPIPAFAAAADRVVEGGAYLYVKSLPGTVPLARAARSERPVGGAWMAGCRQLGIRQLHAAVAIATEFEEPTPIWSTWVLIDAESIDILKHVGPVLRSAFDVLKRTPPTASPFLPFALAHRLLTFHPDLDELQALRDDFASRF